MLLNKKFFSFLVTICMAVAAVHADTSTLTARFLDKANDAYSAGKIDDAYAIVNKALQLNRNSAIPDNVILMAQTIYTDRLKAVKEKRDYVSYADIKDNLAAYPAIANADINSLVRQIADQQSAESAAKVEEKEKTLHEETVRMHREQIDAQKEAVDAQKESQEKLIDNINQSLGTLNTGLTQTANQNRNNFRVITMAIFLICGILLLVFLVVMLVIHLAVKNSKRQHEQFEATLKMVAAMQSSTNSNLLRLGGVTDLWGSGMKSAGSSRWGMDALPEPEQTEEEKKEVQDLAIKCEDLGTKIDQVTGRKNNSKNVSELVYKLANQLGVQQQTAMIYFCAGMVYDAGFLGIDEDLLTADNLTEDQKLQLREHIKLYSDYLSFVPKRYWETFRDAAEKHHANMDGSGYPEGLAGEDIPQIARLIRVAETYVSLSSRRNYKQITDKETAIKMLKDKPEFYDKDVVDALDAIL